MLRPGTGDVLYAGVNLDPTKPPTEVMLQFQTLEDNGVYGREHRAYWGSNLINYGTDGTVSRTNLGALPPAGQWVRLEVPARAVGLEGRIVEGMAFTLYSGRAAWDSAGVVVPDMDGDGVADINEVEESRSAGGAHGGTVGDIRESGHVARLDIPRAFASLAL